MRRLQIAILVIFVLAGAWLLGKGITGLVISQSCCFPPDCPQEYLCDAARPFIEQPRPAATLNGVLGILMLGVAAAMLFLVGKERNT